VDSDLWHLHCRLRNHCHHPHHSHHPHHPPHQHLHRASSRESQNELESMMRTTSLRGLAVRRAKRKRRATTRRCAAHDQSFGMVLRCSTTGVQAESDDFKWTSKPTPLPLCPNAKRKQVPTLRIELEVVPSMSLFCLGAAHGSSAKQNNGSALGSRSNR
jgi:hypothetical protein